MRARLGTAIEAFVERLRAPDDGDPGVSAADPTDPASFVREYAFTVARTLGESALVRGVGRADGEKLFGRRTGERLDVVRTTFGTGDPEPEQVHRTRAATELSEASNLAAVLARRGGPVGASEAHRQYDDAQPRALGHPE